MNRVFAALGIRASTGDVAFESDRVVLRDVGRARAFPQEPKRLGRKEISACEQCDRPLRKVVFTTAGGGEQREIWRQFPLAVDGWMCPACGWSAMPRHITAEESVEYGRQGSAHAASGQFDDAEFWFRRIIGSWAGYAPGYADLGQLSSARADASTAPDEKQRYRRDAESWLRRAEAADPERRLAGIRIPLARMLALNGDESAALEVLGGLLADPAVSDSIRAEAEALATEIRSGKALFSRATETTRKLVLEPPTKPLDPAGRKALEGARALLRQAADRGSAFATSWFLGKVEMRLGNVTRAVAAMEEAHRLDPDHADGCRELVNVYLESDRAQDALPVARRAVDLRPDDAGLRCNLALVLLLTGDAASARSEAADALSREPTDAITKGLLKMIDDVIAGHRQRPRSLAEAEGRKRAANVER